MSHTEIEAKLRGALVKSVEVIRQWHGMGVPEKQEHELWTIYWRSAPEMKQIREALSNEKRPLILVREQRLAELLDRACDLLDGVQSGFLPGATDDRFRCERDELLSEAREALSDELRVENSK